MDMRGGYMRPPRERGGLMRPMVPLRGRGVMGMDRMRLGPPLRPGLRPPVPFVGRGMVLPPHARPRGMGPVMLPRPPMPPPGPMGPLGPRGMLPRPMPPPRPMGLETYNDPSANSQIPVNGVMKGANNQLKNFRDCNVSNKTTPAGQNQSMVNRMVNRNVKVPNRVNKGNQSAGPAPGLKRNRKDNKNRRQGNLSQPPQQLQSHQQMQIPTQPPMQPPVQNMHPAQHHSQPPSQQNTLSMNPPQMQKALHPMQPPMSGNGLQHQSQMHPMQHQPSFRGGRGGMNPRNRGGSGMGRGGLVNTVPTGAAGRENGMNRGAPNLPPRGGVASIPGRGNAMMGGPPPPVPYSSALPASYAVPPPNIGSQIPVKRGGPPMGVPPVMQPKRIRYDSPLPPANGYHVQYQQQPPPQQTMYSSYDVPPPADVYNAPPAVNMPPSQSYISADYNYPPVQQTSNPYGSPTNAPYSSYNNTGTYSNYSTNIGYDSSVDYSMGAQPMNNIASDPYGYGKAAPPVDSYGYSNMNYSNSQTSYEDYSSAYVDASGYAAPVQDPTYGQSVGTYSSYSY